MHGSGLDQFLDSAHLTIFQANLDAMGMRGGSRQDIFEDAFGQLVCALIPFQDDPDSIPCVEFCSFYLAHGVDLSSMSQGSARGCLLPRAWPFG